MLPVIQTRPTMNREYYLDDNFAVLSNNSTCHRIGTAGYVSSLTSSIRNYK